MFVNALKHFRYYDDIYQHYLRDYIHGSQHIVHFDIKNSGEKHFFLDHLDKPLIIDHIKTIKHEKTIKYADEEFHSKTKEETTWSECIHFLWLPKSCQYLVIPKEYSSYLVKFLKHQEIECNPFILLYHTSSTVQILHHSNNLTITVDSSTFVFDASHFTNHYHKESMCDIEWYFTSRYTLPNDIQWQ